MREAVVVLAPDVRAQEVVERRDRPAPRDVARHLQPLRVLVEHRVDDVDERLVAVEEAVPAREEIALEPALAEMLREHLHHAAVRGQPLVGRLGLGDPGAAGDREDVAEPVRRRLVRAEQPEVLRFAAITSRRKAPSTRVASLDVVPGSSTAYARKSGRSRSRSSRPPFACGFALIRRSPRAPARPAPGRAGRPRRTAPPGR